MKIILLILVIIIILIFILNKQGNLKFWKKVSKNPDLAYRLFLKSEDWYIEDCINSKPENSEDRWDGPFFLNIPSINKTVKVYGKVGKYEKSQEYIISMLE